jgi:hypothetical protein
MLSVWLAEMPASEAKADQALTASTHPLNYPSCRLASDNYPGRRVASRRQGPYHLLVQRPPPKSGSGEVTCTDAVAQVASSDWPGCPRPQT